MNIKNLSSIQYSAIQDAVLTELEKANSKLSRLRNEAPLSKRPPAVKEVKDRIKVLEGLNYKLGHPVGDSA